MGLRYTVRHLIPGIPGWFEISHLCHSFWLFLVKSSVEAALIGNADFLAGVMQSKWSKDIFGHDTIVSTRWYQMKRLPDCWSATHTSSVPQWWDQRLLGQTGSENNLIAEPISVAYILISDHITSMSHELHSDSLWVCVCLFCSHLGSVSGRFLGKMQ